MGKTIMCMKDWITIEFKVQSWVAKDIFEDLKNLEVRDG